MDTSERLLGEFREFRRATDKRLDRMEAKIDKLQHFKWKVVGFVSAIAMLIGFFK